MRILISGYYGFGNAGDELILDALLRGLRRAGRTDVTVLSVDPARTCSDHGVKAVDRWDWAGIVRSVIHCDVLISGGGGLIQDDTGSLSLYYYLAVIALVRLLGKKVIVCGVGVDQLKRRNRTIAAAVLRAVDRLVVRDDDSARLLISWGCPPERVEVGADPVLAVVPVSNVSRDERPCIVMVLRPPRKGAWRPETPAKIADALCRRLDARIVFVPLHADHDMPYALSVVREMRMPAHVVRWSSFCELHDIFGAADLVISQRLHGLILAALHGAALIGISDDPKIARFLRELGQKNVSLRSSANHYSLLAVILDIWEWRDDFRRNAARLLPSLQKRAGRTAEVLARELA